MTGSRGWMLCGGLMGLVAAQVLGGCGGQTGGVTRDTASEGVPECEVSEETVDLDQRLPVDFTLRELADTVAGEHKLPGFWVELSDDVVPPIERETRVRVRVTYENEPVVIRDCASSSGRARVPVQVLVEELDDDGRWEFDAVVSGSPERAWVTAFEPAAADTPDAGGLGGLTPLELNLQFEAEGISGYVDGRPGGDTLLKLGAACGGYAELPPEETAADWATSPTTLGEALSTLTLEAERDGRVDALALTLTDLGELACYKSEAPFDEFASTPGSEPEPRPTAVLQVQASLVLADEALSLALDDARLTLQRWDDCPGGEAMCHRYFLRGCAEVTGEPVVPTLYPDDEVVKATACVSLSGILGATDAAEGSIEVTADLVYEGDEDLLMEGKPMQWSIVAGGK